MGLARVRPNAASRSERDDISGSVAASLIGAGMISVLVYPFIATRLVGVPAPVERESDEY